MEEEADGVGGYMSALERGYGTYKSNFGTLMFEAGVYVAYYACEG